MGKYQEALDNIQAFIKTVGAGRYDKDLQVLQQLVYKLQSNETSARQTAISILNDFELYGEFYYVMEDWLVDQLTGNFTTLPYEMESEYLKSALRVELKELAQTVATHLYDEDIENIVDRLCSPYAKQQVLNMEYIEDEFDRYLIEKNNLQFNLED